VIKPLKLSSRGFGLEVEITALICKTKARTYEVPISYYGRSYEEGKKIGLKDGISAIWYIFYYNLIKPRFAAQRRYVESVNAALVGEGCSPQHQAAPPVATSIPTDTIPVGLAPGAAS
jgi:hypothetical protein